MQLQVGKEGLFAPLFFLAFLAVPASAGDVPSADLARCAALSTDALKLACFEALAAKHGEAATRTVPQSAWEPPVSGEEQERTVELLPSQEAVRPAPTAADLVTAAAPVPAGKPVSGVTPEPRRLDESAGRQHLGSVTDEEKARDVVVTTISNVIRDPRTRKLTFEMTNGQVWRQMESGHFLYPKGKAFDVEIRRGLMGDYQMRVDGAGRMTRIVRVR